MNNLPLKAFFVNFFNLRLKSVFLFYILRLTWKSCRKNQACHSTRQEAHIPNVRNVFQLEGEEDEKLEEGNKFNKVQKANKIKDNYKSHFNTLVWFQNFNYICIDRI